MSQFKKMIQLKKIIDFSNFYLIIKVTKIKPLVLVAFPSIITINTIKSIASSDSLDTHNKSQLSLLLLSAYAITTTTTTLCICLPVILSAVGLYSPCPVQ